MTDRALAFARLLQHGDSFFPGGAASFSWGLETLSADGQVTSAAQVEAFIAGQLAGRWATFDWPVTLHAFGHANDLDELARVDHLVEAQTLARELRDGSRRAGAALLGVHAQLGTAQAVAYRKHDAPGHLAVVQGLLWHGSAIDREALGALSAHTLCFGLLGAAIRLGVIGHVDGQRILQAMALIIEGELTRPPRSIDEIFAFTPRTEIASMGHEIAETRLFMN